MLRVTVHAGPLKSASRFNTLAWLDIGYERLEAIADYKFVLFQSGQGATAPMILKDYPRWSSSLWDLVARALALALTPDDQEPVEAIPALTCTRKRFSFASCISAHIIHESAKTAQHQQILGSVEITQAGRKRGTYTARFTEHARQPITTEPFTFATDVLRAAELLLHACAVRFGNQDQLPPRPALCVPTPFEVSGVPHIALHHLVEPARTGFAQWLLGQGMPAIEHKGAPAGAAPEDAFAKFLKEAI